MDSVLIFGSEPTIVDYNLNISHRTTYKEVLTKKFQVYFLNILLIINYLKKL